MKLYSVEELDERCAEFRPIPFKLQAAMFGSYNETGMNPRPPSSFHSMTTANTSEALKKRYFDLRRNPERIEPEKRRGHFIEQRINAIDMMNRRRWFNSGRTADDYDIMTESGEQLEAMFRSELADLPMIPLPRIPDAEGAEGDVGNNADSVVGRNLEAFLRDRMSRPPPLPPPISAGPPPLPSNIDGSIPSIADAVEYREGLRDRLFRGLRNMAYTISRRNAEIARIRGQEQQTMAGEDVLSREMRAEQIANDAREDFEREYDNVRDELNAFTMAAEEDIEEAQARLIISQEEELLEREAELRRQRPEAEGVRRASSLRRADRDPMRGFLVEREELRQTMEQELERRPVSARFGVRGARPRSQSSVSERSSEALQRYQTTEAIAEAGAMGSEDIDVGLF